MFAILFGLSCLLFRCEGQVKPPSNGTRLTFFPGTTVKIDWSYVGDISQVQLRDWVFNSSDGSRRGLLTEIYRDNNPGPLNTTLIPRFEIEKPAALILKNVDQTYNGLYTFSLKQKLLQTEFSKVVVFIAKKPTVRLNCSSSVLLKKGDNVACECKGLGGNPPAGVTWYKDGKQIGKTGTEKQILTLIKVDDTDGGSYKCVAESYPNAIFKDEKSVRVDVYFKPKDTSIEFTQNPATFGKSVTITCKSRGFPEPRHTIFHNDTQLINVKTHTICQVAWSNAGTYKCFAVNEHGNDSLSDFLNVKGEATGSKINCESCNCGTVVVWPIVVALVSGIIIGILFSYITRWCSHRPWFKSRKLQLNPEPKPTEVDTTYEELDLTNMNTEEKYKSLECGK